MPAPRAPESTPRSRRWRAPAGRAARLVRWPRPAPAPATRPAPPAKCPPTAAIRPPRPGARAPGAPARPANAPVHAWPGRPARRGPAHGRAGGSLAGRPGRIVLAAFAQFKPHGIKNGKGARQAQTEYPREIPHACGLLVRIGRAVDRLGADLAAHHA